MSNSGDIFDYIIIGGGSSGSILTNRLSSNGSTVCLIEAGPKDTNPYIHIPAGYIKNIFSKKLTWNFFSEPSPHTNFRSFSLPQGRVLGGSSSINGLNYVRGQNMIMIIGKIRKLVGVIKIYFLILLNLKIEYQLKFLIIEELRVSYP